VLHVCWSPLHDAGYVQIGFEADRGFVAEALREGIDADRITLFTTELSRDELNRLIRMTRRSRDAAYGRDE
jgi:hypothetical protein